jgi:hypothetical protein
LDNGFRVLFEAKWQAAALRGSGRLPKPFWETGARGCSKPIVSAPFLPSGDQGHKTLIRHLHSFLAVP